MEGVLLGLGCIIFAIAVTNYPRRQPDTLAPVQFLTMTGSVVLVLLQVASAVAMTHWLLVLPRGAAAGFALLHLATAIASTTTTCALLAHSLLRRRRAPSPEVDAWLRAEVDALKPLACGGYGIDDIHLYGGSANGFEVEVIKTPDGAGIRVGGGLPKKLKFFSSHPSGGKCRVRTLIRFILLHELGHLLNGDHVAYQFARATLLGHLWYLGPILAWAPIFVTAKLTGAPGEQTAAIEGMGLLLLITMLAVLFQRFIATRFAWARERLADWRATVTLSHADRTRLLEAPPGDSAFLEKALTALLSRRSMARWLATLLTLTWPRAERIDERVRQLVTGQSKGRQQPYAWAAFAGTNVGALVVLTISLVGPMTNPGVALGVALSIATIPIAILVGRADPTDPLSNESSTWDRRAQTAALYWSVQVVIFVAGYLALHASPPLSPNQYVRGGELFIFFTFLGGGTAFIVGTMVELGPAVLRQRGEMAIRAIPFLFGMITPLVPLSLLLTKAIGSRLENPFSILLMPVFGFFAIGCVAIRSKRTMIRRFFPYGSDGLGDSVVRSRIFIRDFMADMNDIRRHRLFIRLTLIHSVQTTMAFLPVALIVLLFSVILLPDEALGMTLVFSLVIMGGSAIWPAKKTAKRPQVQRNPDIQNALFRTRGTDLDALLEAWRPAVVAELRRVSLLDPSRTPGIDDLRRAAEKLELAKDVGAKDVIAAWSAEARVLLKEYSSDGAVHAWKGGPASAYWTAWAARLAAAMGDAATSQILVQSAARLLPAHWNNVRGIVVVATIARISPADAEPLACRANVRKLLRATDSLSDIAAIAACIGGDAVASLRRTVRSRLWTTLHENSRRQLLALFDIIDAGRQLGDEETDLWLVAEERVCDLLREEDDALLRRLTAAA